MKESVFTLNLSKTTDLEDLNKLTDLNSRLVNFLNLVKDETKRNESLKTSLIEKKQEYLINLKENNFKNYENLLCHKKYLNDLCFGLNSEQVKERHNRIKVEWFSKLFKFEQENLKLKPKVKVYSNFFNEISYFSMSSESELSQGSSILLSQSNISSSQTSLSSLTSSMSSSTSSYETASIANSFNVLQSSEFSLEEYLTNVKTMKSHLEIEYEKKYSKYLEMKDNTIKLNTELNDLNCNLDKTKIDNVQLSENVNNLKKEIEFYNKLKAAKFYKVNNKEKQDDESWYKKELDNCNKEINYEFEQFNRQTNNAYEDYLAKSTLQEIEILEEEYNEESLRIEKESDEILNELSDLNTELNFSVEEYSSLLETNQQLTDRLNLLSTQLGSFGQLSKPLQDRLILNYSIRSYEREINKKKIEVKNFKQELNVFKDVLVKRDIDEFLSENKSYDPTMQIIKNHFSEYQKQSNKFCNWSIQNHYTQIEYTKSNLFAYLTVNFDLANTYSSKQNKVSFKSGLSCNFRIVNDSIDGHSITIENNHRILDFDLSGWTIRREILNCSNIDCLTLKSTQENLDLLLESTNMLDASHLPDDVVEFTFPKGFRLKRRKKINLVAAGSEYYRPKSSLSCYSLNDIQTDKDIKKSYSSSSLTNNASNNNINTLTKNNSILPRTNLKCACCACKTLATRKGSNDLDVYEVKEISNWGTGILVVTKFTNSKNVTKLINYKCLKQIWLNDQKT